MTKKGQKLHRPAYKALYEEVCANETRLGDLLSTARHEASCYARDLDTARKNFKLALDDLALAKRDARRNLWTAFTIFVAWGITVVALVR